MLSASPTYTRAPRDVNMGENGTIQWERMARSNTKKSYAKASPSRIPKGAGRYSEVKRMIVSKLSALPALQHMDQKLRTIRTFSAATQHSVTAALPLLSFSQGGDLIMSVALRRASRHGSWSSFDLTSMFQVFPKSDRCFAALLRVLMFARSLLNLLL